MRHNWQNTEQTTAVLWGHLTRMQDELLRNGCRVYRKSFFYFKDRAWWLERDCNPQPIGRKRIQRLCSWSQEKGKTKETADRHDKGGLERTETLQEATHLTRDRRV